MHYSWKCNRESCLYLAISMNTRMPLLNESLAEEGSPEIREKLLVSIRQPSSRAVQKSTRNRFNIILDFEREVVAVARHWEHHPRRQTPAPLKARRRPSLAPARPCRAVTHLRLAISQRTITEGARCTGTLFIVQQPCYGLPTVDREPNLEAYPSR
jgi:hypothetical protein